MFGIVRQHTLPANRDAPSTRQKKIALVALFIIGGLWLSSQYSQELLNLVAPSVTSVPIFTAATLDGTTISNQDLPKTAYIINSFASWCPICRVEHPFMLSLNRQKIPIVGLNYKNDVAAAKLWLATLGNPYAQTIFDPQGQIAARLGIDALPVTLLVTANGDIAYRHVGELNHRVWQDAVLEQWSKIE